MLFHIAEPAALLGMIVAFIVGVYTRDTFQVLAARALHDPKPQQVGRLGAPLKQRINPFSAVAFLICGNGWAEPVPMNDVWRKRRFQVSAAVLAGPLAYLLLAFLALLAVASYGADGFLAEMLAWMAVTFASLFILSLIPVPPADGGRVLFLLAPQTEGWNKARLRLIEGNWGIIILLLLLLLPVLIGFPSVVGQLLLPLLRALGNPIGLPTL